MQLGSSTTLSPTLLRRGQHRYCCALQAVQPYGPGMYTRALVLQQNSATPSSISFFEVVNMCADAPTRDAIALYYDILQGPIAVPQPCRRFS